MSGASERATWGEWAAALAALVVLYLAVGVADHEIWAPTEPTVAGVVWNMVEGHGLAVPRVNDFAYLEKPPLYYWAATLAARLNGALTAGSLRLPAALFGLLGIGALGMAVARRHGQRLGLAGALFAATTLPIYEIAHRASTDIAAFALCCVAFAIFACTLEPRPGEAAEGSPAARRATAGFIRRSDLAIAVVLAVAFYAKNLFSLLVVAPPIAVILAMQLDWQRALRLVFATALASVLLVLPWALVLFEEGGSEFLRVVFFDNVIGRFLDLSDSDIATGPLNDAFIVEKGGSPVYYFFRLPALTLPWIGVAAAGLWARARERSLDAGQRFALAGLLCIPLVLTLSSTRVTAYLIPAAFFCAWWSAEAMARPAGASRDGLRALVLANLGAVAALFILAPLAAAIVRQEPALALGTLFLASLAVPLVRETRRDGLSSRTWLHYGIFAAVGLAVALFTLVPILDARKSQVPCFESFAEESAGRRALTQLREDRTLPLINYYLGRRLEVLDQAALLEALGSDDPVAVFVKATRFDHDPAWLEVPGVREASMRCGGRLVLLLNDAPLRDRAP